MSLDPALVWFRDDLRLADNPALNYAVESGRPIVAIYIYSGDDGLTRDFGSAQKWFLHHALDNLQKAIAKIGGRLDLHSGKPEEIIHDLIEETGAGLVTWNRRVGETEIGIDSAIKSALTDNGIEVKSFQANLLHEPYRLKTGAGGPYRVYTPFWRSLSSQGEPRKPLPAPASITAFQALANTVSLSELNLLPKQPNWASSWTDIWKPSEEGARATLAKFLDQGIHDYNEGRNVPAKKSVSRLSPFLRFGVISPFQIWYATRMAEGKDSIDANEVLKFLKEVVWREFSYHLLFHYPDLRWKNFAEKFNGFPWRENDDVALEAWQKGLTGYPIVDAGMRELWQTGYMHNRVRMVVGSFLVKHLLIDWRKGEEWFWDTLVDGDPASNTASWQWIAGCGADASPYFRVFNPILQGKKFDANGTYVRQYIPEISALPDKYIHTPWEAPEEVLAAANVAMGQTYPNPIVDHALGRNRALEAFKQMKPSET